MPRVTISIKDKQAQPYRFPLDRETVTLGRGSDNDITIQSGSVSVHHAKMIRVPGGYELRDLDSTNGLKLNEEKKISVRLKTGMMVKIGDAEFFFQLSDEEQEELKKEAPTQHEEKEESEEREDKKQKKGRDDEEDGDDDDEEEDDDDEDEEEERKKKSKKKKRSRDEEDDRDGSARRSAVSPPRRLASSGGGGGAGFIIFLILAAIAFAVGMAVRYQKETGKSLIEAVLSRGEAEKAPAESSAEAPADEPADEPPPAE